MDKILVIIKREYLQRVKSRGFWVGTILTPVFLLVVTTLPMFLAARGGGEKHITVLDQSGDPLLYPGIKANFDHLRSGSTVDLKQQVVPPDQDVGKIIKDEQDTLVRRTDFAYIVLRPGVMEGAETEYYSSNTGDIFIHEFERAVGDAVVNRRMVKAGLDVDRVGAITKPVEMKLNKVSAEGVTSGGEQTFIIAFVMTFFIYMTTLMYGISVLRGVMEEKQSRIVEVLVSSVRPFQVLIGKLVGIGAAGLTQYLVWTGSTLLISRVGLSAISRPGGFTMPTIPPILLLYFIVYFILGYFLFASLYAMIGSMVSNDEDAQQLQRPITFIIIAPMIMLFFVLRDPGSPAAVVLSLIPFFTPTLMMLRIALVAPPLWQIVLSMVLMVVSIIGAIWISSRIYRIGILMYGKRPNLAELGRWLRYS